MVTADMSRCGLALLMTQTASVPAIYALAFGLALAGVFYGPAYQSLLPAVVPAGVLGRANALSWSTVQSSHVLGAAAGGTPWPLSGRPGPSRSTRRRSFSPRCCSCGSENRLHRHGPHRPRAAAPRPCAPRPRRGST